MLLSELGDYVMQTYFKKVEGAETSEAFCRRVYNHPTDAALESFYNVNNIKSRDMLYPGRLVLIPSIEFSNEDGINQGKLIAERVDYSFRHASAVSNPRTFNRTFQTQLWAKMKDEGEGASFETAKAFFQGRNNRIAQHTKALADKLKELNRNLLDTQSAVRGQDFAKNATRSSMGQSTRKVIVQEIQDIMKKIPSAMDDLRSVPYGHQDAVAISTREVKNAYRTSGSGGSIKKISKALTDVDNLNSKLSAKNVRIGIGLTAVGGAWEVYNVKGDIDKYSASNKETADIYGAYKSSQAIGGVAGGYVGGEIGAGVAALVLAATPVGWVGLAVVGICVVGGAVAGSMAGKKLAGDAAEYGMTVIDPSRAGEVKMVIENADAPK